MKTKTNFSLLQATRCFAALSVAYVHTEFPPAAGNFGVDVFFVLSGCVMGMLLEQVGTAWGFLGRRLIRVWPLYAVTTLVFATVVALVPGIRRPGLILDWQEVAQSLVFLPYVNSRGEVLPFLSPGWTLNFEMVFYVCCAISMFFARKARWLVAGMLAVMLNVAASFSPGSAVGTFYSNPVVFEFVAGLIVWRVWSARRTSWTWQISSAGLMAAAATVFAIFAVLELCLQPALSRSGFGPWSRPLAMALPASFLVYAALCLEAKFSSQTSCVARLAVRIGDASYSIYLTHLFVVFGMMKLWAKLPMLEGLRWAFALGGILGAVLLGMLVHEFFDKPLQQGMRSLLAGRSRPRVA